jgi:hypothetical protein
MQTPPGSPVYFPTGQLMQAEEPVLSVYVPTGQFVHEFAPTALYLPTAHGLQTLAAPVENVPIGQIVQDEA